MKLLSELYKSIKSNNTVYRSTTGILLATTFILLVPLVAMQITDEVVWDLTDFAVAGVLLVSAGLTYKLAVRKLVNIVYRAAFGIAIVTALLIVWITLAVGIIGTEDNPANLMFIGVLAVGIIGAIIARLQPREMSIALFATALAHILVVVIVLIAELGYPVGKPSEIVILNGFFIALWIGSGWLFRNTDRKQATA